MMNLTKYEKAFLIFFVPLFGLKMMDITAENILLKLVGVACFCSFSLFVYKQKYPPKFFGLFNVLLLYSGILVLTSGKQAAFFSVLMMMLMYKVDMNRKIYKYLFNLGLLFLFIFIVIDSVHVPETTMRYLNGEWIEMTKRNNLLFVSFTAVVSLYLLVHRDNLSNMLILKVFVLSILMFGYVGSRTGLLIMIILVVMLFLLQKKWVYSNKLVRFFCITSPLCCMLFCIYTALAYEENEFLIVIDMLFQGRIYQNNLFMNRYAMMPFGQHIVEGADTGGEFLNLDCAYMDFLICEGVIFAILWTLITILVIRYFYDQRRLVEVSILVTYAFYGITETFLPNCFLNISLFLYGEYIILKLMVPMNASYFLKSKNTKNYNVIK